MKQKLIISLGLLLVVFGMQAQQTSALRINEILIINEDNYQDDYGNKNPCIEIYNHSSETVNIAGCYLTNDLSNPKKYRVPKDDVQTNIRPHQHVLFLADERKVENFKETDALGIGMTILAMTVVFVALILCYGLFKAIDKTAVTMSHLRVMKFSGVTKEQAKSIASQSGEIYAAIALAIYEATEYHDEENTILTIKNAARHYSPWSSKIYTLREIPIKVHKLTR